MSLKKIVVVLGMHRSGTSAITRGLQALGIDLGDSLIEAVPSINAKGFWEDVDITTLNIELLRALGHDWHTLAPITNEELDQEEVLVFKKRAIEILQSKLQKVDYFGLKDPRICRLLPFWKSVFSEMGLRAEYVIACRNPLSVAQSLKKRDGFDFEKSYFLWLEHMFLSVLQTEGCKRVVVNFDNVIADASEQLIRIANNFGILTSPDDPKVIEYKDLFLDKSLRHTEYSADDLVLDERVPPSVVRLYNVLCKLAKDEITFDSVELGRVLEEGRRYLQENYRLLKYVQKLEANKERAELNALVINGLKDDLLQREQHLSAQLKEREVAVQAAIHELNKIMQTRLMRLRNIILHQPWGARKIIQITYLTLSLATPRAVRTKLQPVVRWLRTCFSRRKKLLAAEVGGYRVKVPVVKQDAPKVVHVIANFMTGGSSRLVVDLVEYLGQDYAQYVLTRYAPNPPAYLGLSIEEQRDCQDIAVFINYFSRIRPNFIHMHYWGDVDEPWYARAIEAAKILNIPVLENVNTPIAPHLADVVRYYVYVSDYVRNVFGYPNPAHVTVYPGSDFSHFMRADREVVPSDCVGMVYRLEHDKLNERAIEPFILIAKKRPQTKVLIVGGGTLLPHFQQAARDAGVERQFEFTGYVEYDTLPMYYRRMTLFIAPVWKESFGQVSPFAMNMRVPVIGYDVGAIGEIVNSKEMLAPYGDAEKLAEVAIKLLDNDELREKMGREHQRRAKEHFSVQTMIDMYAGLYAEMIRK